MRRGNTSTRSPQAQARRSAQTQGRQCAPTQGRQCAQTQTEARDRAPGAGPARRRRRARPAAALVVAVALLVAGTACASTSGTASRRAMVAPTAGVPERGGSLVVGVRAETDGWNPALSEWADTGNLEGSAILEPLATVDPHGTAKPWLAASWYPNTTFDRWVIDLQPGITFQDGEPFDAAAVVQNIDLYTHGTLAAVALGPLFAAVKALSPLSVEVDLTQPWAAFPSSFLIGGSSYMMAPAMLEAPGGGATHPIGTGPFSFGSWTPGDTLTTVRNPHYWGGRDANGKVRTGQGLPYLDQLEFKVITDDSTRTAALQNGDINLQYTTNATDANTLASSDTVVKDWDTEQAFVMLSTAPVIDGRANPLSNIHARRALAYATDASQIARQVGAGVQLPTSPWSPDNPWGLPSNENGYVHPDLAEAKAEVAQFEQATGQHSISLSLAGLPNVDDQRTLQQLQAQWRQAGISVTIQTLDQTAYITKIATGDYQAAFFRNYGYSDPDGDFYFWSSTTAKGAGAISINFSQYSTPQIDHDLAVGRQSGYPAQRRAAYHDLARQLNAGFTDIWLYSTPYSFIASPKVQGLKAPGGPSTVPFGNLQPKTWWATIWLQH